MPDEILHIQLFGDMTLRLGDEPLPALPPMEQSLLAYLLLHHEAPQSRQHLAFLLWPDSTDAQARSQLRKLYYRLRQDLPEADTFLQADTQTVGWRAEAPFTLDVAEFEGALEDAARTLQDAARAPDEGKPEIEAGLREAACDALERAVALYGGDLLPGCYDDWIAAPRARLSLSYLRALEQLVALCEQRREYDRAIDHAQRLLRHDPLHEPGYRALMRLYALTGNRASALRAYHTCATTLQRELDVEPGPDTVRAYERLLQAPPSDSLAATVPAAGAAAESAAAAGRLSAAMVGRRAEWEQLMAAWHGAMENGPQLVLIEGEAGIGKTRLAGEFARWAQWQGAATAAARCYAAEGGLAYAPVVDWLRARPLPPLEAVWRRELSRLLPDLLGAEVLGAEVLGSEEIRLGPMTEAWQRQRLFQALARAILGDAQGMAGMPHVAGSGHIPPGPQPLLLLVDDLQWCDRETLEWLHFVLRHQPGADDALRASDVSRPRLLVLGTVRAEEVDEAHPLHDWLRAVRHTAGAQGTAPALTEVALGPLDEAETRSLAADLAGGELDPDLAACIYAETEGNPLFVVEMVRAGRLSDGTELACPPQGLPPRVQATIEGRLAQLSPAARDLAGLAATVGRGFGYDVLEKSSALDSGALLRALDELWQRRVVRETAGAGYDVSYAGYDVSYAEYDFSHEKLREVAYAGLSEARRQVLHRRVAGALEALHAGDLDAFSGQIAAHYERGGQAARAIPYYLRAAGAALRVYANEEAAGHYERVLALRPAVGHRVDALGGLGQIRLRLGQSTEAQAYLREAISLGQETGFSPHHLARLYIWLGQALYAQSRYEEQARVGEEGLALLGDEIDPAEAALIYGASALGYPHLGDKEKAREVWDRAAAYVEALPYVEEWGTIYQRVFTLHLVDKRVDEARRWLDVLEHKIANHPDERGWGILHQRTEDLLAQQGDLEGAIAHLHQALACAIQTGNVIDRGFYHWRLGLRSLALGDLAAAEEHARAAFEYNSIVGSAFFVAWARWLLAGVTLCQGKEREAVDHLEHALPLAREADRLALAASCHCMLGQVYLGRADRDEALRRYQHAAELCTPGLFRIWRGNVIWSYARVYAGVLSGLEEAYAGVEAFRAYCLHVPWRERLSERSGDLAQLALDRWFLEPAAPANEARTALGERFDDLQHEWTWHDPYGDCRHALQEGLVVEAANGRDLWHVNWSAPRLIRPLLSVLATAPERAPAPVSGESSVPGVVPERAPAPVSGESSVPGVVPERAPAPVSYMQFN